MHEFASPSQRVGNMTCRKLDGSGLVVVQCQKATFDYFRFDQLPPAAPLNPARPEYRGGRYPLMGIKNQTARSTIRIAYEGWPGHGKPKMVRIGFLGEAIQETWSVIHNHLLTQGLPYLYLCNKHGNPLGISWQAHMGVHV